MNFDDNLIIDLNIYYVKVCLTKIKFQSVNGAITLFLSLQTPDLLQFSVCQGIVLSEVIPPTHYYSCIGHGSSATDCPSPIAGRILVVVLLAQLIGSVQKVFGGWVGGLLHFSVYHSPLRGEMSRTKSTRH